MAFAPSASWNSRSITHLANYPSPSLPMIFSDESVYIGTIVIDDYRDEANIVGQALGLPLLPGSQSILVARIASPPSVLLGFIRNRHPRYLIYADTGILSKVLPLQCNVHSAELDAEVRCPFHNDVYAVYEVNY